MELNDNLLSKEQLKEKNKEKLEAERKKFEEEKLAINRIFATPDGKLLGKWLVNNCGVFESSVLVTKDGISSQATVYNEARRGVYLELRKYFDFDTLINLEIKEE